MSNVVEIDLPQIETIEVDVYGLTPHIQHNWSKKTITMIADKQQGKKKAKEREPKNPQAEFEGAMHKLPDGRFGFPAGGFKKAMVRAAKHIEGLTMVDAQTMFNIVDDAEGLVALSVNEPQMREDPVKVQMTTDLRYRPAFEMWAAKIRIRYNAAQMSQSAVVSLLERAGNFVGIGEWRPEKGGIFGTFTTQMPEQYKGWKPDYPAEGPRKAARKAA